MSITFQHATLPNGLNIIAELDPDAHSSAIGFFVKAGARDETASIMGVSHFLEHMMFKGTEQRAAEQVDRDFDDIGASHNAFTSTEMTAFHAHCLPEHLPRAEEVLSDIMRPAIRPEDFNSEKKVILEEIAMYDDHPFWVLYEHALERYYNGHPMGHRVLGTTQTVTDLTRDQMQQYFTQRYSADNTVVALAGQLDFDDMVRRLEEHCGHWNTTRATRDPAPPACQADELVQYSATVNRHYMLMLAPAPAMTDDRRYAAGILAQILGDHDGSRLYWALIETGLAEEAQAAFDGHDGLGQYMMYAACTPENAAQVQRIILEQVDALIDSVDADDLERMRSKVATSATLHGELPAGRMRRLGQIWTYLGQYRSLEDELARIDAVTLDELREVHQAFPLKPKFTAHLSPQAE